MMFYSQCLLDKKGPLRTIWIAAHLERKLKKNQVTQTSISAAVDTILYSKVPIALRLSGFLLFGVVKIYSRKVNYLYQDCGETLLRIKRAFHSARVDLPQDANMAPFHAVTLPETSEFEYMELDNIGYENTRDLGSHLSTRDQITLHERPQEYEARFRLRIYDHVHGCKDIYTMLCLDEGNQRQTTSHQVEFSNHEISSLEEDVLPPLPLDGPFGFDNMDVETSDSLHSIGDASPSSSSLSAASICAFNLGKSPKQSMEKPTEPTDFPEPETLRTQQHILHSEICFIGTDKADTDNEYTEIGEVDKGQMTKTNKHFLEEILLPENDIAGTNMGLPTPPTTPKSTSGHHDVQASILGGFSPAVNIMTTPKTPAPKERRPRSRKRKQILDESIVLPNQIMRQQLTYTDDICRIRRKVPCTVTESWKSYRLSHIEQLFLEPAVPGMCKELQELYNRVLNHPCINSPVYTQEGKSYFEGTSWKLKGTSEELQENKPAPSKMNRAYNLWMTGISETSLETEGAEMLPGVEPVTTESDGSEARTPSPAYRVDVLKTTENMQVGEAHGLEVSMFDKECDQDFSFLEEDSRCEDYVVSGNGMFPEQHGMRDSMKAHPDFDTNDLSTRTRAVACYLKRAFEKSFPHHTKSILNLDRVLSARTKKEAARIILEILALKSKDYIEVEQQAAYSSILVSAKPKFYAAKF